MRAHLPASLLVTPVLLVSLLAASPVSAGVESHSQYRHHGPSRYVVAVWEVVHDNGVVKVQKRTFKWKPAQGTLSRRDSAPNERGVLPAEWYGPILVDKSVDHVAWVGSYWREDGAYEGNIYEVELKEGDPAGPIQGSSYPVEVSFRMMKRPYLMQPYLGSK